MLPGWASQVAAKIAKKTTEKHLKNGGKYYDKDNYLRRVIR